MRGLILVILGIFYNNPGPIVHLHFSNLRYGSVLGRIGLAWMFAALIFMNTKLNFRIVWFCGLLLGYWLLLLLFPAHDLGSTDIFSREGNLTSHIDRLLMPGKLYLGNHDPEGILSTMPAIGTALLGMFTGEFLISRYLNQKPLRKVLYMALAAICLMIIGQLWNLVFPINKNLWTSSFVCFVGGLSLLLFTLFYLIIDVWNFRKWAFFFVVIGLNPITIYLTERIVNLHVISKFLLGGLIAMLPGTWSTLLYGIVITSIGWVFLYILYRYKLFLKI
jgi:predicted acyltransferase